MKQVRSRTRQLVGEQINNLARWGIDLRRVKSTFRALAWYSDDLQKFKEQAQNVNSPFPFGKNKPYLLDKNSHAGAYAGHYFVQDLFVAQRIFANNPKLHVDVGSRIDGFVGNVASFRTIEVLDIRPMESELPSIRFKQCDLMAELDESLLNYCDSLSSLHVLEHFGLGRYGDPIDHDGHIKGFNNLYKILQPGGTLYFSVPIGPQRVEFNAHRVFSLEYLTSEMIANRYKIDSFSYIDDRGRLFASVELTPERVAANCNCQYGCGIFEMTKLSP